MSNFTVFGITLLDGNEAFPSTAKGNEAHEYREKQGPSHRSVVNEALGSYHFRTSMTPAISRMRNPISAKRTIMITTVPPFPPGSSA